MLLEPNFVCAFLNYKTTSLNRNILPEIQADHILCKRRLPTEIQIQDEHKIHCFNFSIYSYIGYIDKNICLCSLN